MTPPPTRALARELFDAALAAAHPARATRAAMETLPLDARGRRWIVALGKAALPMTGAALDVLAARALPCDGGLVVVPEPQLPAAGAVAHPALTVVAGDHPVPGVLSFAAAEALAELVAHVAADDTVIVLLSGGTSSLVAAPVEGVSHDDVRRLFAALLASGADIHAMNAARKRFTRWGAGRLAVGLAPARVHVLVVSDVPGDELASIGSGPCVPDALTAAALVERLERAALLGHLPGALRDHLALVARGALPETPKPGDPRFATVSHRIVASNAHALDGAAARARALGLVAQRAPGTLGGEASACGVQVARMLLRVRARQRRDGARRPACLLWGGETTVTLGRGLTGRGGRSQELALAAAGVLAEAGEEAEGITLLAAGTDGRDGPTDAAGAIVDAATWPAIVAAGRDPAGDLVAHDAYAALASADALLRTGPSGTNVMDVVIGIVGD